MCIVDELFRAGKIEEDESPPILKLMQRNPKSQESLSVASGWLKNCLENHRRCNVFGETRNPPKRLINVSHADQDPVLIEVSPNARQIQWLSLSYQWGGKHSKVLDKKTMPKLMERIPISTLDPTIQDAIFVARALKIPYVWIDALCIVQGGTEWNEEASKMNEIYGGSTITLAAANSSSVAEGFLRARQPQYVPVSRPNDHEGDAEPSSPRSEVYISPEWDKHEDLSRGDWSSRGWTMQEGLLPNRLLIYTSSQMIWECCEEQRYERGMRKRLDDVVARAHRHSGDGDISFPSEWFWELGTFMKFKTLPDFLPVNRDLDFIFSTSDTFRLWYDLVEEYSSRRLTNPTDRLLAISGLAKIFGEEIQCKDYVAGLWEPDLVRGLMWHTEGASLVSRSASESEELIAAGFPSWSWISGGYEVAQNHRKGSSYLQALSEATFAPAESFDESLPFGTARSGRVILTGPLKRVPRLYNPAWKSTDVSMSRLERHLSATVEMESLDGVSPRYSSPLEGHFAIVQMLTDLHDLDLLVLEPTGQALDGIRLYCRVGIVPLRGFPQEHVTSSELVGALDKLENSISARLGMEPIFGQRYKVSNEEIMEIREESWPKDCVYVI